MEEFQNILIGIWMIGKVLFRAVAVFRMVRGYGLMLAATVYRPEDRNRDQVFLWFMETVAGGIVMMALEAL